MRFCLMILAITLFLPAGLNAQAPAFEKWEYITADGRPIELELGHADPCVIDWDGDGLKDLLVGQYMYGKIRFYKNSGTNSAPVFTTFTYMQADGADITLTFG